MLNDPGVLAVRSSAKVCSADAARLAAELLRPRPERCWVKPARVRAAPESPPAFVETGIRLAQGPGPHSQADVLWALCQLARFARELHVEFAVELDGLRGRVSTGGLDAGARALLAATQARPERRLSSWPARSPDRAQPADASGRVAGGETGRAPRPEERRRPQKLFAHAG